MDSQLDLFEIPGLNTVFQYSNPSMPIKKYFNYHPTEPQKSHDWISSINIGYHTLTIWNPGDVLPVIQTPKNNIPQTQLTFLTTENYWLFQGSNPPVFRTIKFINHSTDLHKFLGLNEQWINWLPHSENMNTCVNSFTQPYRSRNIFHQYSFIFWQFKTIDCYKVPIQIFWVKIASQTTQRTFRNH